MLRSTIEFKVHKVYKVHKVTGVLRTEFVGSFAAVDNAPAGSIDFIDFTDFTDYKKVITSGPVLKRRSRMLRFGVKG